MIPLKPKPTATNTVLQNLILQVLEEPNKTTVRALIIDQVDKMLYLRDHDTGSFVCQAETLSDLAKLALSYKKIEYAAVWYDEKFVFFVKGNVKFNMIQIARQLDEG